MKIFSQNKAGFHSSEVLFLLVVFMVFIIFLLPQLNEASSEAKDSYSLSKMTKITWALDHYYEKHKGYPPTPIHGEEDGCLLPMDESVAKGGSTFQVLSSIIKESNWHKGVEGQGTVGCMGSFYYRTIEGGQSYILISSMNTVEASNYQMDSEKVSRSYFGQFDDPRQLIRQLQPTLYHQEGKDIFYIVTP